MFNIGVVHVSRMTADKAFLYLMLKTFSQYASSLVDCVTRGLRNGIIGLAVSEYQDVVGAADILSALIGLKT